MKRILILVFFIGLGMVGSAYARSQEECKAYLTSEDLAQAFGRHKKPLTIAPSVMGCTYPMESSNIVLTVTPFRSESDWAYNKKYLSEPEYGAKPISGIGADAIATDKQMWFISSNRSATVTLACLEDRAICSKVARAIDRNLLKMNSITPEAAPTHASMMAAMKNVQRTHAGSSQRPAQALHGFLPDILICPAQQSMEVNRTTLDGGKTLQVVLMLTGITDADATKFYQSTLTKKGWALQGNENREAPAGMRDQAQIYGYKGTAVMTFAKGDYTVDVGVSTAGNGVTVNISQTQH